MLQSKGHVVRYAVTRVRGQETGVLDVLVGVHDAILGSDVSPDVGKCKGGGGQGAVYRTKRAQQG
jgi:hypothetical protein